VHCFSAERASSLEKVLQISHKDRRLLLNVLVCIRAVTTNKEVNLMVSQNILDLLLSGKVLCQKWRRTHPDVQAFEPDLHGADLHGADLSEFDLHGADLTEANLQEANLQDANLQDADLRSANLRSANLSDANLLRANLHRIDLRGANLCRANLSSADLSNADLRGADLVMLSSAKRNSTMPTYPR